MTAATRAQRSGYVIGTSAFGGTGFRVSPFLVELGKTADFEDAIRKESGG